MPAGVAEAEGGTDLAGEFGAVGRAGRGQDGAHAREALGAAEGLRDLILCVGAGGRRGKGGRSIHAPAFAESPVFVKSLLPPPLADLWVMGRPRSKRAANKSSRNPPNGASCAPDPCGKPSASTAPRRGRGGAGPSRGPAAVGNPAAEVAGPQEASPHGTTSRCGGGTASKRCYAAWTSPPSRSRTTWRSGPCG